MYTCIYIQGSKKKFTMGGQWTWWAIFSCLLTVAMSTQNDVDHHEEHNEFGCDCMEYWTCITRYNNSR